MMLANELVAEIQRLLKEIIKVAEKTKAGATGKANLDWSILDRIDMLILAVDAEDNELLNSKFTEMMESVSRNRNEFPHRRMLEELKALDAILETQLFIESIKLRNPENLNVTAFFQPSNEDRKRMLTLCAELRELINNSDYLTAEFRNLLLKRLSAMEFQINSNKGTLDTILGGVNDIGEAAGKFGKNTKPLVDRVRELFGIARKNSEHYKELPSPEEIKKLPPPNEEE